MSQQLKDLKIEQPVVEEWMKPEQKELRGNSRKYLLAAFSEGIINTEDVIKITLCPGGTSSAVYKISYSNHQLVIKMNPWAGRLEQERVASEAWSKQGVKTPKVLSLHQPTGSLPVHLMVMEYIDAPTLDEKYTSDERVKRGIAYEMGKIQAQMHKVKGDSGFGELEANGKLNGIFATINDELEDALFKERVPWLVNQGYIDPAHLDILKVAIDVLAKDLAQRNPAITHNDFGLTNIFSTDPLTIFDPIPKRSHPYLCLAHTVLKAIADNDEDTKEADAIYSGYGSISKIDNQVFAVAELIAGVLRMHTSGRKGKLKDLEIMREIVSKKVFELQER